MRLTVAERHERLLAIVRERQRVRVSELARELGVSDVTARRDVEELAAAGLVHRSHGVVDATQGINAGTSAQGVPSERRRETGAGGGPLIGMLVPSATYYYAEVVRGVRTVVSNAGGRLMIGISNYQADEEQAQIARMLENGVDGLLLTPAWPTGTSPGSAGDEFARLGLPTVLVERRGELGTAVGELERVCTDHADGAFLAVRHLAGLGHKQIVLAARESPTAAQLRVGYRAAIDRLKLPQQTFQAVGNGPEGAEPGDFEATLVKLADAVAAGEVDAALVHNDSDALVLVQHLQRRHLSVPGDLALVAYDDEMAAFDDIALTTIAPPKFAVGQAAARLLLSRIVARSSGGPRGGNTAGTAPRQHLELLPELRVRASCGAEALSAI